MRRNEQESKGLMQYNINKFVGVVAEEETFTLQI
jgi:hypothetical protein